MSEANIKRMFATKRITIDRLEAICRFLDMELDDLFTLYEQSRTCISQLTHEQEEELVNDSALLFAAVCVRNHLSFEDIVEQYSIDQHELIQSLAKLDRLKIIDLLPNNRIKLRISEHFHWIQDGPIEKFYEQTIEQEFLKQGFDDEDNPRVFLSALLGDSSRAILMQRIESLADEFVQLQKKDRNLPFKKRFNIGLLIALREWEFTFLERYGKDR